MADNNTKPDSSDTVKMAELEKSLQDKANVETEQAKAASSAPGIATPAKGPLNRAGAVKTGALWFMSWLNLLLMLTIVGGGAWFWQQWHAIQVTQSNTLQQQTADVKAIEQNSQNQLSVFKQQNEQLQASILSLNEKLQTATMGVESNRNSLAGLAGRRPADWLLAEADYLVRMAGRKLWLEDDVRTALLMLQSADSRLEDLADPSLIPIRKLLASDIQTLQQINPVSLPTVALAISGMVEQVKNLPLALPRLPDIKHDQVQTSDSASDWSANLAKVWAFFKEDLIRYEPRQQPIQPLLSKQQQWLAREQLKYTLLHAQSAVLMDNPTLFEQSIKQSLELLLQHFDLEHVSLEQFVASLQNLQKTDIERVYPPMLQSAQPIKDILQQRIDSAFVNKSQSPANNEGSAL